LQTRSSRQVRPRQRLVQAQEIERNPAVDLPGRFAGGEPEVR
jgi:hypothetical protein